MLLERIEIVVAVEQFVARFQAESCDQAVDGLADSYAPLPQQTVVLGRSHGELNSTCFEDMEFFEIALYFGERCVTPNTLQHLAEDEVGQPEALPAQLP